MGYDLHITRKEFWAEEEGEKISYDEWINYLSNDAEIFQDKNNTEGYFSFHRKQGDWIFYHDDRLGEITVKNPPNDVILKMVKISLALNAKVQGDDQEFYDLNGNMHRAQENELPLNENKRVNPYDRYIRYLYIIAFATPIVWHLFFSDK